MWVPCPTGCWRRRTMAFRPLLSRLRSPRVLRVPSSPLVLPSSAFAMEQLHSSPACLINMRPWYWDRRTSTGTRPHSPNSNGRASVFSQEKRAYGSKRPSEGVWGTRGGAGLTHVSLACPGAHDTTADWGLKPQTRISHSSGGWKAQIKAPADSESVEAPLRLRDARLLLAVSSHGGGDEEALGVSFIRALIPFIKALPSWPNLLPRAPSPTAVSTCERPEDANIPSTARAEGSAKVGRPRFGPGVWTSFTGCPGATAQRSRGGGVGGERHREREGARLGGGDWGAHGASSCVPAQPLVKIEPYFAERFSNDTHQVPINSSKW